MFSYYGIASFEARIKAKWKQTNDFRGVQSPLIGGHVMSWNYPCADICGLSPALFYKLLNQLIQPGPTSMIC